MILRCLHDSLSERKKGACMTRQTDYLTRQRKKLKSEHCSTLKKIASYTLVDFFSRTYTLVDYKLGPFSS
uniref:Uncharacterized protein n=1 Tax=Arundo donax TaxID=35708 RepID=A0A0A9H8R0_ARUDO